MATWTPDQSFYLSPRVATKAARVAGVAAFDPERNTAVAVPVVDLFAVIERYEDS